MSQAALVGGCAGLAVGAVLGAFFGVLGPVPASVMMAMVGGAVGVLLGAKPS